MNKGRSNTELPRIIDFLGVGKENAIKQIDICKMLRCTPDQLKAAVQRFRRTNTDHSLFICSDHNGYYFAKDKSEIEQFVLTTSKQAISRFETIKEAKRMLKGNEGQDHINGAGEQHGSFQG